MRPSIRIISALAIILLGAAAAWMFRKPASDSTNGVENPTAVSPDAQARDATQSDVSARSNLGVPPAPDRSKALATVGTTTSGETEPNVVGPGGIAPAVPPSPPEAFRPERPESSSSKAFSSSVSENNVSRQPADTSIQPSDRLANLEDLDEPRRDARASQRGDASAHDDESSTWQTHKVTDGDTLSSLAERYLGSAARYAEIYEANRDQLTTADMLPIGVELRIPPVAAKRSPDRSVPRFVPIPPGALSPREDS